EARCAEARVVAADRDEHADAEAIETLEALLEQRGALRRIRARDAEMRAAAEVDAARVADGQREDARGVAVHEPAEAVLHPEHLDAGEDSADRGGADHAGDAGGGAAAAENRELRGVGPAWR